MVSPNGLVGWVEERWFGLAEEPVAVAVRLLDGRRGLLVDDDVAAVLREDELLTIAPEARLLQLDPPHVGLSDGGDSLTASWTTSGTLDLPEPPARRRVLPTRLRPATRPLPARATGATGLADDRAAVRDGRDHRRLADRARRAARVSGHRLAAVLVL